MDKTRVKQRIEEIQQGVVSDLEQAYERDSNSADIDEAETKDPEDFSHQQELNQMARTMKIRLEHSRSELRYIQGLSTDPIDTVGEGALVMTEKFTFYISVPIKPFDMDGQHVVGISTNAPIYHAMHDKKAGESFTFDGKTYRIQAVS